MRLWWSTEPVTGDLIAAVYRDAMRRGELPPPGPRGPGVNVRKPWAFGLPVN